MSRRTLLELAPANWEWRQCLAFPVDKLNSLGFSSKLYKWIRFATSVVLGARGKLCAKRDFPALPIDYDSGLPAVSSDLYYHTTDEERLHMFPIGLNLADIDSETSSRTSTNQDNFRGDVEDRDKSCVLTGDPAYVCNAVHLIPHSQGNSVCDFLYGIIFAYTLIDGSTSKRSPCTDVEKSAATTAFFEISTTLEMVCF